MVTVKTPLVGPDSFPSDVAEIETVAVSLSVIVVVTMVDAPRVTFAPVELVGLPIEIAKSSFDSCIESSVASNDKFSAIIWSPSFVAV